MDKLCTIAIPVWNAPDVTRRCLESLIKSTDYPHKVLIIDNGSMEETRGLLRDFCRGRSNFHIERFEENAGYLKAANFALRKADTPYICLLNNDTMLTPGWLTECIAVLESRREIGVVSPTSNEVTDKFTGVFLSGKIKDFKGKSIEVNSCLGSCFILKREVVEKIGYFDPVYGNGYFEEVDYCLNARAAGYVSVLALGAYIEHVGNSSFGTAPDERKALWHRNRDILDARWGKPKRILMMLRRGYNDATLTMAKRYLLSRCRARAIVDLYCRHGSDWAEGIHFNIRRKDAVLYNFFALYLMAALKKKAYDIIITDVRMPSLNGFYDFAGLEALDADYDVPGRTVDDGPDVL